MGAAFGGFSSLIILLPKLNFIFNILVNILLSLAIVLISFGYKNYKVLIKRTFVLFLISFGFTGIILFLLNITKNDFIAVNNNVIYFYISPILLIIFSIIAYAILWLVDKIKFEKNDLIHKITFFYKGNKYSFLSKYDTCCNIKEPFSGSEVILAEKMLLNNINISQEEYRLIPFESLGGDGMIKGFLPDELLIDNNKINRKVYIGISENIIKGEINSIFNYKNICE
jgi:stage II sporulation protein GA (sporulation sigma-E factor processing peptidase)